MSQGLYERYKDALRRGHVAALRERFGAAIAAYEEAAELAPDRALPYASLGRVLERRGRYEDALSAYGRALGRAAGDEVALAGRAEVLVRLGRRVEAAETLVRLAEANDAAGRLADACDAARRALELAESRPRRRFVERLVGRLRGAANDEAAIAAMERALRILEPAAPPAGEEAATFFARPPDPEALIDEAEALLAAGDPSAARERYLEAAAAYRAAGQLDAALDACLPVLRFEPADPAVHLVLADLYADRAWRAHAAEKLRLLGRLAALTGDAETERRLAELAAASGSGVSVAAPPPD